MKNLEPLNSIFDQASTKRSSLSIFHLDELIALGNGFEPLPSRPVYAPCNKSYNLVFDYGNDSFCSIFSENIHETLDSYEKKLSIGSEEVKLASDSEILSSEFERDHSHPILTSDKLEELADTTPTDSDQSRKRQKY